MRLAPKEASQCGSCVRHVESSSSKRPAEMNGAHKVYGSSACEAWKNLGQEARPTAMRLAPREAFQSGSCERHVDSSSSMQLCRHSGHTRGLRRHQEADVQEIMA